MIELNELHIKNFLSHLDSYINFDTLDGLVLLEGYNSNGHYDSNGSGKSSILEGIVYALTGNTLRNVGVNDVVNRVVGKNTVARLNLTNNSTSMSISRYRKHDKHGDSILLLEDGKDISSRLNKSTQETINNKLGIPYNVLVNTILLGEGLSSRFTQLSDTDKKSLIESTLSLSYDVNALRDKVNSYVKNLKSEVAKLEGSISSMKTTIDTFNPKEGEGDKEKLNSLIDKKNILSTDIDNIKRDLDIYSIKIKTLEDSKSQYEKLYSDHNNYTAKIEDLKSKIHLVDCDDSTCTLCGQKLSSEESKAYIKNSYNEEISELVSLLNSVDESLRLLPEYSVISSKLSELQKSRLDINKKYTQLNNDLLSLTREIAMLESNIEHRNVLLSNIESYKITLDISTKEYEEKVVDLSDYEYMYKLFSPTGLIVYILEDAISYINDRLSIYTDILIDKSYKFELLKGKLTLIDNTGASYQSLSNGEKRRLDISIQFALHDYVYSYCGLQINFCFIDEILDTLDVTGVDNIFEVLRLKMNYCNLKGIIVITHNSNLKDKFDKIITVVKKEDGLSYIK